MFVKEVVVGGKVGDSDNFVVVDEMVDELLGFWWELRADWLEDVFFDSKRWVFVGSDCCELAVVDLAEDYLGRLLWQRGNDFEESLGAGLVDFDLFHG